MNREFWKGRSVFLTGHTGFKGGWTALWLSELGAKVHGYSLEPPTTPSFFAATSLSSIISSSTIADIRDIDSLSKTIKKSSPSVVIHMAAQALVLESYNNPVETFSTNVMGTVNVLESVRKLDSVEAVLIITSDKCYKNTNSIYPYAEHEPLGGDDPYSSSKASAEIVTEAYRNSFFSESNVKIATARAGNVIGGGDWAPNRLIPDVIRSLQTSTPLKVRNPNSIRPWQHVFEPISGYTKLIEMLTQNGDTHSGSWNFGPGKDQTYSVKMILDMLKELEKGFCWEVDLDSRLKETKTLKIDSSKALHSLGWSPRWGIQNSLNQTIDWHRAFTKKENMLEFSVKQIQGYGNSL